MAANDEWVVWEDGFAFYQRSSTGLPIFTGTTLYALNRATNRLESLVAPDSGEFGGPLLQGDTVTYTRMEFDEAAPVLKNWRLWKWDLPTNATGPLDVDLPGDSWAYGRSGEWLLALNTEQGHFQSASTMVVVNLVTRATIRVDLQGAAQSFDSYVDGELLYFERHAPGETASEIWRLNLTTGERSRIVAMDGEILAFSVYPSGVATASATALRWHDDKGGVRTQASAVQYVWFGETAGQAAWATDAGKASALHVGDLRTGQSRQVYSGPILAGPFGSGQELIVVDSTSDPSKPTQTRIWRWPWDVQT